MEWNIRVHLVDQIEIITGYEISREEAEEIVDLLEEYQLEYL